MGFSGISIWQLLIILVIVVLIFGTKRLKGMGTDIGGFIKGFRSAMSGDSDDDKNRPVSNGEKKLPNESKNSSVINESAEKNKDESLATTRDK